MASSRLERIGNIYSRVRGLLRSGAMKPEDKPIWYEVYEAFPPKVEPQYGRKASEITIHPIFYPEDIVRAKFYERFGSPGLISLANNEYPTPCQKFLDRYKEMEKGFSDENELFEAVAKVMEEEKSVPESVSSNQPDNGTSMASMFSSAVSKSQPQPKINVGDLLTEK
ncbi:28S ribosomal protein S23, mitochondrial [Daphnia magna]|uniref:28S ribosomal protein S23, mitochondrial n=1 Tax=Daphnia magna TaxID=35525 RepID=UPI001E1BAF97|nr:28S ribosomal protein S23, mitochondrial [Daphnia magna]